jgi:hypothetical protein
LKRQKEQARKARAEEKREARRARKLAGPGTDTPGPEGFDDTELMSAGEEEMVEGEADPEEAASV